MPAVLDRYIDERATAWSQVQGIRAALEQESRELKPDEDEAYTRALDDVDRLSKLIEREERANRMSQVDVSQVRSSGEQADPDEDGDEAQHRKAYNEAFGLWLRHGNDELEVEQRRLLRTGAVSSKELRAQGVATQGAGGFTVPEDFLAQMTETMKAFGGLLAYATIFNTDSGNPMMWAANDDTGNEGVLLAENTQVGEQDFVFEPRELGAYTYTSKMVRTSLQLIQDSAFDMETWLPNRLGTRLGRAMSRHLATGTGVDQPQGLTTGPTRITGAAGQVDSFTFDNLIDLEYSIDAAYRGTGRARWFGNDAAFRALRKVTDNDGQYRWQPSVQAGEPDLLNGHPITVDNSLPAPAAGVKSLVFGDVATAMVVRIVNGATVLRLTERYADFLQVGFLGFERMDSVIDDPNAIGFFEHPAA